MNDGKNHVFLIICGAGNHSANGAVLKNHVHQYLKNNNYDFYFHVRHGTQLVRL
jgi:DNA-nicking Smr family endonuclease